MSPGYRTGYSKQRISEINHIQYMRRKALIAAQSPEQQFKVLWRRAREILEELDA